MSVSRKLCKKSFPINRLLTKPLTYTTYAIIIIAYSRYFVNKKVRFYF